MRAHFKIIGVNFFKFCPPSANLAWAYRFAERQFIDKLSR
jgi:hypothetical protein